MHGERLSVNSGARIVDREVPPPDIGDAVPIIYVVPGINDSADWARRLKRLVAGIFYVVVLDYPHYRVAKATRSKRRAFRFVGRCIAFSRLRIRARWLALGVVFAIVEAMSLPLKFSVWFILGTLLGSFFVSVRASRRTKENAVSLVRRKLLASCGSSEDFLSIESPLRPVQMRAPARRVAHGYAHSFGTIVVTELLLAEKQLHLHRLSLHGSVLDCHFGWAQFIAPNCVGGAVKSVRNARLMDDNVVRWSVLAGLGDSTRTGFVGSEGAEFHDVGGPEIRCTQCDPASVAFGHNIKYRDAEHSGTIPDPSESYGVSYFETPFFRHDLPYFLGIDQQEFVRFYALAERVDQAACKHAGRWWRLQKLEIQSLVEDIRESKFRFLDPRQVTETPAATSSNSLSLYVKSASYMVHGYFPSDDEIHHRLSIALSGYVRAWNVDLHAGWVATLPKDSKFQIPSGSQRIVRTQKDPRMALRTAVMIKLP